MVKKVGHAIYVHRSNIQELLENVKDEADKEYIPILLNGLYEFFPYDIVKYDKSKHSLSIISSPNWDTANEPDVGDGYCFSLITHKWKYVSGRNQIYHQKELFVSPNYKGFDIDKAKARTAQWNAIPNLDKHRIGSKKFWIETLTANGMEV